jgi:hypothetical protein
MGYYTFYTLTAYGPASEVERFHTADPFFSATEPDFRVSTVSDESMKWYSSEDDVKQMSNYWPKLTFVLTGEGEDSDDKWKMKIKKGEVIQGVRATISYPGWREPSSKSCSDGQTLHTPTSIVLRSGITIPLPKST